MSVGTRNPRIDLLRGISITLVLLHHFNIAYRLEHTALAALLGWPLLHAIVRNGNYAVTVFFAISGFLITSNAQKRWPSLREINAAAFYQTRAARILPCLLLVLVIVDLLAACSVPIFGNHPQLGGPVPLWVTDLASLTFWMNVLMGHSGWLNYALCVQWSLSIEEVFYLSFPILCLVLKRERHLLAVWTIFIVLGPIWRATHAASEYGQLYAYLSCFDGIAWGCCAAIVRRHIGRHVGRRLPARALGPLRLVLGALMTGFYLAAPIGETVTCGVTLMAGASALLLALEPDASPHRPSPALAPIRTCGRLSYELYLFHIVILGLIRTVWPPETAGTAARLLLLAAYLILSLATADLVHRAFAEPLNARLRPTLAASSRSRTQAGA